MNNAPVVYVPTQPEGDGLTLPMLLSLLAHGIVLGILIYTYQMPELEVAGSIETTMVTPGELAQIQGQILANRAASAEQAASASAQSATQSSDFDSSDTTEQSTTQPSSQRVPVFTRSDKPATTSSPPILMSEEQHQKRLAQLEEYNRNMTESAAALDGTQTLDDFKQQQREELIEEQKKLKSFRAKSNEQPKINKPTRSDRNINIELGDSSNAGKSFDLADGQSTATGPANNSKASGGGSTRSTGEFKSGIADKIQRNLTAPVQTQGLTARITLKLDAKGNVLSAKASGSNSEVNEAAEKAAYDASPLPIDMNNPTSFASLVINVKVT